RGGAVLPAVVSACGAGTRPRAGTSVHSPGGSAHRRRWWRFSSHRGASDVSGRTNDDGSHTGQRSRNDSQLVAAVERGPGVGKFHSASPDRWLGDSSPIVG